VPANGQLCSAATNNVRLSSGLSPLDDVTRGSMHHLNSGLSGGINALNIEQYRSKVF